MAFDQQFRDKFWSFVNKEGPVSEKVGTRCWEWTRGTTAAGYGQLTGPLYAHRVSWEIETGEDPGSWHVLHHCDNRRCVRSDHLFLGTQRDNNKDRTAKGRTARGEQNGARTRRELNPFVRNGGSGLYGESHPGAVLSDEDCADIRLRFYAGESRVLLAAEFKVSRTQIYRIGKGLDRAYAPDLL